jgi:large subunit ribosomal protein L9
MTELGRSLEKLVLMLKVKTGDDGKMFGTVTTGMIADELKHQFDISLEKRKIHLAEPIRSLGEHEVEMHLHADVKCSLKLQVESANPLPPPEEPKAESQDARTEKRGRRPYGAPSRREEKPAPERPATKAGGKKAE